MACGIGGNFGGNNDICRQEQFNPLLFCFVKNFKGEFYFAVFDQRFSCLLALRLEKGEDHRSANKDSINLFEKVFKDIYFA